jgi:hypothetical protein
VAADDLPAGAGDLAGPVWEDGELPAHLVEHHVMVPAVILEVDQAGPAAVLPVHDVVRLASGRGLVAAALVLPQSTQETGAGIHGWQVANRKLGDYG